MKTVGLISYRQSPKLTPSDELLTEPLRKEGFHAVPAPWDDPHIDWNTFDLLIFRSCWNYYYHYPEFCDWLSKIETRKIPTWNPISIIRWNSDKRYLLELEKKGIPIIPSIVINEQSDATYSDIQKLHHWSEIVVKPVIGESAYSIRRINSTDARWSQRIRSLEDNTDFLVQPFMSEIYEGEFSLIFFNGIFSHAIMKRPNKNDFRTHYQFGGKWIAVKPRQKLIDQTSRVIRAAQTPLLYARVDGILKNGDFLLMELELFDPQLCLDFDHQASFRFVHALKSLNGTR